MTTPPGWYPDPQGPPYHVRYWDGARWTEHRHAYAAAPVAAPRRATSKAWLGWVVAGVVAIGLVGAVVAEDEPRGAAARDTTSGQDDFDDAGEQDDTGDAGEVVDVDEDSAATPSSEPAPSDEPVEAETSPSPEPATASEPAAPPEPRTYLVAYVADGDTLALANGEEVRLVGIDAPEQGQCGSVRAAELLTRLVEGRRVTLAAPVDDRDRYGRLLRYVGIGTMDAGLRLLKNGLAIARYDSRDGYDAHPREALYHRTDDAAPNVTCPTAPVPLAGGGGCGGYTPCIPSYPPDLDCADVNGPIQVSGSDPHGLDADGDGIACEW